MESEDRIESCVWIEWGTEACTIMTNFTLFVGDEALFGWEAYHSEHKTLCDAILTARWNVKTGDSWQIVFRKQIIVNRADGFPGRAINESPENSLMIESILASLSFLALLKPARIA